MTMQETADSVVAQVEQHFIRANAFHNEGKLHDSVIELKHALKLMPDCPEAHFNLANVLRDGGQLDLAIEGFIIAIQNAEKQGRHYPDALVNLGDVFNRQKRFDNAEQAFQEAVRIAPDRKEAWIGLGMVQYGLGNYADALANCLKAARLDPWNPELLNNIGLSYYRLGQPDEALATYDRAVEANPNYAEGHTHRGLMLLLQGRLAEGFVEYEWRWKTDFFKKMNPLLTQPVWQGEDLTDKTIVVYGEQGYGDTLQFGRYLPLLADRGAKVVPLVEENLVRLMHSMRGLSQIVPSVGGKLPPHDYVLPMMSLPHRFGTTMDTIPADVPYLSADAVLAAKWKSRLAKLSGLRIGVVWAGRPEHLFDRERSMTLRDLAPLAAVDNVSLVSLQQGPRRDEEGVDNILRPGLLTDFAETAGIIQNLDIVLSVDTAVVHLAGAMGKPTWLLLPAVAEWRWGITGDTSRWYPTMRIFRQSQPNDWAGVVKSILDNLKSYYKN